MWFLPVGSRLIPPRRVPGEAGFAPRTRTRPAQTTTNQDPGSRRAVCATPENQSTPPSPPPSPRPSQDATVEGASGSCGKYLPCGSGDELFEARQVHVPAAGDDDDVRVRGRLHLAGEERGSGGGAGGLDEQLRAFQEEREAAQDLRVRDEDDVVHERAHVLQRVG